MTFFIMTNPPINKNYCATVVILSEFIELDNCDNVKHALIFGNCVIVGKDTAINTKGLFFPVETQLSHDFLYYNNLYRNSELNFDKTIKGYFENSGRVRCMKFRGNKSEGFFISIDSLQFLKNKISKLEINVDFDTIDDVQICKKYVVQNNDSNNNNISNKKSIKKNIWLVDNQFKFHVDTLNYRKNKESLSPNDRCSITYKLHGTSFIVGKLLTFPKLNWYQTILSNLNLCTYPKIYSTIFSSRRVIKNNNISSNSYYNDLWKDIKNILEDKILNGVTLYGECVGFDSAGIYIQDKYDYGCSPSTFKLFIYRITFTNVDGNTFEFSWDQVKQYCKKYGLETVPELFYGRIKNHFLLDDNQHFHENYLKLLEKTYLEKDCYMCNNTVPAEGIVIRKDDLFNCEPYKLKSFSFLNEETKKLDKGYVDIESNESVET